jgi:type II secretory pathway pseudopilin PulG
MYKKSGRSFVTIMIVVALSALFLRIAIEKIIKFSIAQNESTASLTLKLISTALENYAKDNRGVYPPQVSTLTRTSPAYLDKDYIAQSPFKGYHYSCSRLDASGYSCSALP